MTQSGPVPICAGMWLAWITIAAGLVVPAGRSVMPWGKMFPDLLCYRTAGRLVAAGQSPYDAISQSRIQREAGWDRARDGRGVLEFLPFYYPPWFAAACVPLGSVDAGSARTVWFFVNTWLLLASGVLLCDAVPGVPRTIALALVPLFFLSILSLLLGQTAILILFLAAAALGLLDRGRDIAGGAVLACLTTKPQLSAVLLLGVLIWAARRRRWRVVTGFALALSALTLFGEWLVPSWPVRLWESMRRTPTADGRVPVDRARPGCLSSGAWGCGRGPSGPPTWPPPPPLWSRSSLRRSTGPGRCGIPSPWVCSPPSSSPRTPDTTITRSYWSPCSSSSETG